MDTAKFFDRVYCINLDRRPDRWQRFLDGVPSDWPFAKVERVAAIDGNQVPAPDWWRPTAGAWGCYRTHHRLIEQALNEGLESILILEDDALFGSKFAGDVKRFLGRVPDDWGMLYFGGQHLKADRVPPRSINEEVCVPHNVNRTHAYALRGSTMEAVYRHLSSDRWQQGHHVDHHLGRFLERHDERFPVYCPRHWLVGQAGGESNITRRDFPDRFWNVDNAVKLGNQPFVSVVGLHSSGSSALAGLLWGLGVYLGRDLGGYYGNQPGGECGYEDRDLADICESIIPFPTTEVILDQEYFARLKDWIAAQRSQALQRKTIAGGKYPHFCRLGDALQEFCGDKLRVIVSERNLDRSIASLQRRCGHIDPARIEQHQRWLWDGLQNLQSSLHPSQLLVVPYDDLLESPELQAQRITEFLKIQPSQLACRIAKAATPIRLYSHRRTGIDSCHAATP